MSPSLSHTVLATQSDARLARLVAGGDERAFEGIVRRYTTPLRRYCQRMLSPALAEDVVQQTFLTAWSQLRAGAEIRDLRPWLYRLAHNAALNTIERAGYHYEQLDDAEHAGDTPDLAVARSAEVAATVAGIRALPRRQREALVRTALNGESRASVACDLGLSDGAVAQLLHRARTTLRAGASAITPLPLISWLAACGTDGGAAGVPTVHLHAVTASAGHAAASGGAGATVVSTGAGGGAAGTAGGAGAAAASAGAGGGAAATVTAAASAGATLSVKALVIVGAAVMAGATPFVAPRVIAASQSRQASTARAKPIRSGQAPARATTGSTTRAGSAAGTRAASSAQARPSVIARTHASADASRDVGGADPLASEASADPVSLPTGEAPPTPLAPPPDPTPVAEPTPAPTPAPAPTASPSGATGSTVAPDATPPPDASAGPPPADGATTPSATPDPTTP